jgi:NAD(P)H-hydrate repair Nnr-like enzyme with NAD(P)H-hydrate dehydratase domain
MRSRFLGPFASETPLILTPHPGEMARLLGTSTEKVQKNRRAAVLEAARRAKAVVVLKGPSERRIGWR